MGRLKLKPRRTASHQTGKTPMSEYISAMIRPYLNQDPGLARDDYGLRTLGDMAGVAWNLSRVERMKGSEELVASTRADLEDLGPLEVLDALLNHARTMGPRESRLMTKVRVFHEDGEVRVIVSSVNP